MRYLLAALALTTFVVRAASPGETPDISEPSAPSAPSQARTQKSQAKPVGNIPLLSSGGFEYKPSDHPAPVGGIITGTGVGKSTFDSLAAYQVGTNRPNTKSGAKFQIVRADDVTKQGLEVVADGGKPIPDTNPVEHNPEGHHSLTVPAGQGWKVDEVKASLQNVNLLSERVPPRHIDAVMEKAGNDRQTPLKDIHADVEARAKAAEKQQKSLAKQAAKTLKSAGAGGQDPKPAAGGGDDANAGGTPLCKRDGSLCSIGSRPKKITATGKNAASTVAKKTAGNPMSRKAVTAAATSASRKVATGSKSRLASTSSKALTAKKPITGSASKQSGSKTGSGNSSAIRKSGATSQKALGIKKSGAIKSSTKNPAIRKQTSKTPASTKKTSATKPTGTKKLATKQALASKKPRTGKMSTPKTTGTIKKSGMSAKGPSSIKATTKKPATGKAAPTSKKPVAHQKGTAGQKLASAKPTAPKKPTSVGTNRKQTFTAPTVANKSSPKAAKPTKKKNNRRDLTWNRPRMVYEAVQKSKRSLTEESVLDQLD